MEEYQGMSARDIMTTEVVTAEPDTPISKIVRLMLENNIGSIVIVGPKKEVLGIITERDLISKVLAKELNPRTTRAEDIMTRPVITVDPEASIGEVVNLLKEKNIGHLPVVENGRVIGIIAEGDVIQLAPEFLEILRIRPTRE